MSWEHKGYEVSWNGNRIVIWVEVWTGIPALSPKPSDYCQIGAWNKMRVCDPTAVALALGFLKGEQIQPLLDWLLENVECGGRWEWEEWKYDGQEEIERNREWLEEIVKAVVA